MSDDDPFFVVAREPGAEHPALPTWASDTSNPVALDPGYDPALVTPVTIEEIPGAYQLLNVLTDNECHRLIETSERLGYLADAAVSLPRRIRHNDNLVWVADDETVELVWQRCMASIITMNSDYGGAVPLGINARWRFYRYQSGDYFKPHTDGAWPGSRIVNRRLVTQAYDDRYSQASFILYLTDDYTGGATRFHVRTAGQGSYPSGEDASSVVDVRMPRGSVLCFPHGTHPMHCVHSSELITQGVKYIIRTDVLYSLS